MDDYQIFISYRRQGGEDVAGRISDRFTYRGYKVFYDIESMRSGVFNKQIYDAIDKCTDVLVVLPPKGLDRCSNPDDWVRKEIAYAIKKDKNIIPVMLNGFEFPEDLPEEISKIKDYEAILPAPTAYFDAVIDRITGMLKSTAKTVIMPQASEAFEPANKSIEPPQHLEIRASRFADISNKYVAKIRAGHGYWQEYAEEVMWVGLEEFIKTSVEKEKKAIARMQNPPKNTSNLEANAEKRAIHKFNLIHNFESMAIDIFARHQQKIGIDDERTIMNLKESLMMFKNRVRRLYIDRPVMYERLIAELLWLFFELDEKAFAYNSLYEVMENAFECKTMLIDFRQHQLEDRKKFDILNEVSYTVMMALEAYYDDPASFNEEIMFIVSGVLAFLEFCNPDRKMYKRVEKYLYINYMYIINNSNVLSLKAEKMFERALFVCRIRMG